MRAPSSRERRWGTGEHALLGCEAWAEGERVGRRERRGTRAGLTGLLGLAGPERGCGPGWAAGWFRFFSFSSSISFPFLFLIQTKLNLFEFKFEFEFKLHSIK